MIHSGDEDDEFRFDQTELLTKKNTKIRVHFDVVVRIRFA